MSRLRRLIHEVHRRSLWQVLAIYLVASWVVFEIVQTVTEGLGLPLWFPALAALLLLIGLPIVLATAFVQEGMSPTQPHDPTLMPGVELQSEARPGQGAAARGLFTWRNAITGGVLALALWGVVATGWYVLSDGATGGSSDERKSVAVLPLANMSANPEDQYFTDGIHDAIIEHLAKIAGLRVISRTSVMEYRNATKNIRQIAEELGVATVLEGGVQRAGDQVRITAQLIAARADEHLWAESYERELTAENVFAIQSDVAEQIASALRVTLTREEKERIEVKPTENLEAYEYHLRGNEYFSRLQLEEDVRIAVQMYERAVELDPNFAAAYAALAQARIWLHWSFGVGSELPKAKAALDTALRLAPDLAEARLTLGDYLYYGGRDYENALEQYKWVRERAPSNARAVAWVGWIQRRQGKWEEAVGNVEKAIRLNPRWHTEIMELGFTYRWKRRYPEAERYYDRAIALAPDIPMYHREKAFLYLNWEGSTERAWQALREAAGRVGPAGVLAGGGEWRSSFLILIRLFADEFGDALEQLTLQSAGMDTALYFLAKAELRQRRNQTQPAHAYYDSARVVLERRVGERSEQFAPRAELGLAYAGLGRAEEAVREGQAAIEGLPVSMDALDGARRLQRLATIYVTVGQYEAAIEQLELLLSIPSPISVPLLRVDPLWDPLRDHPRFQALLDR